MMPLVGGDLDEVAALSPVVGTFGAKRSNIARDVGGVSGSNPKEGTVDPPGGAPIGAADLGISTVWIRLGRTWPIDLTHQPTRQADSVSEAVEAILAMGPPAAFDG